MGVVDDDHPNKSAIPLTGSVNLGAVNIESFAKRCLRISLVRETLHRDIEPSKWMMVFLDVAARAPWNASARHFHFDRDHAASSLFLIAFSRNPHINKQVSVGQAQE